MSFKENIEKFDSDKSIQKVVDAGIVKLEEFQEKYPFHLKPEEIELLTPDDVFNPGVSRDSFFYWLEYNLKPLGKMNVGSTLAHRSARDNIAIFKDLLKKATSNKLSLTQKVDSDWENLKGFGAEKIIAKKIISVYSKDIIPVFTTAHLREFYSNLVGPGSLPRDFERKSLGAKYEVLMDGLRKKKNEHSITKDWNSVYFMKFLYEFYRTPGTVLEQPAVPLEVLRRYGLNSYPHSEMEVLFLFSKLHVDLGYPIIVKVQSFYPDVQVIDINNDTVRIELEYNGLCVKSHLPAHSKKFNRPML